MIEKKGVYVGYRMVCNNCNKVTHSKYKPEHSICSCKNKLMWFGENLGCDIMENKKAYPRNHLNNIFKRNIKGLNYVERALYFGEKYPLKQ